MPELSVWAPKPKSINIAFQGGQTSMHRDPSGCWSGAIPESARDYSFILDDAPPIPDPRSPWQPFGVHGPSRVLDHASFQWSDDRWQAPSLASAVVYELHIGTFTEEGTFDAAITRIPHLKSLGVMHVELMPVAEFPGDWGWGYDGVDLYAPHHAYGGPEGLKRLVDALHANGLAAILDVVYNHLGPSGNYLSQYGPYFTTEIRTPWGDGVNLSGPESREVRRFFIDNALMWLRDYHFDGLRLDAIHALADESTLHFLEELATEVRHLESALDRPLWVIAESDLNDPRLIRAPDFGGYGLDAQWSDDFHHALHTLLTGERSGYYADFGTMQHLAKAIENGYVYDGQYSVYRRRQHGQPLDPSLKSKLLGYLQTHDQVGNRAQGDRITHLAGMDRAKMGAALVFLGPFIPLLFQGEEWGASTPFQYFTDHSEPELGRAVSEGRRREFAAFGWAPDRVPDPQDPETFRRSKLNWQERDAAPHREMLNWHRDLIAYRKAHPELRSPEASVVFDDRVGLFIMRRPGISVVCNFGASRAVVAQRPGSEILLTSSAVNELSGDCLALAADSVAIMKAPQVAAGHATAGPTG